MFNTGRLKFSFEIWASEVYEEDGVTVVDANPGNQLTAMAIVTTPAIPSAVALKLAAELDIHAYEDKIWRLLDMKFHELWHIVWMALDYAVIYLPECGHMLHVGYRLEDGELVETETYEVTFTPVETEVTNEMDKVIEAEATNVVKPALEETTAIAEDIANMDTVTTEETAAKEDTCGACGNPEDAACGDNKEAEVEAEAETAEVENDIDDDIKNESDSDARDLEQMRRDLEQAQAELAQYKAAEAAAKMAEKREAARKYAEREHLDLNAESVKTAIENADYEALAAEVMAKPIDNKNNESYRVVAEMKIESPFGNMFEKAN